MESTFSRLAAPTINGTFQKAYNLLIRLVRKVGWDELLKYRAAVFVMEEEARIHKSTEGEKKGIFSKEKLTKSESENKFDSHKKPEEIQTNNGIISDEDNLIKQQLEAPNSAILHLNNNKNDSDDNENQKKSDNSQENENLAEHLESINLDDKDKTDIDIHAPGEMQNHENVKEKLNLEFREIENSQKGDEISESIDVGNFSCL